jgi:hypothetical protein
MPRPDAVISEGDQELFDRLAEYTRQGDSAFGVRQQLCGTDDRLTVPSAVFNAVRNREEAV